MVHLGMEVRGYLHPEVVYGRCDSASSTRLISSTSRQGSALGVSKSPEIRRVRSRRASLDC